MHGNFPHRMEHFLWHLAIGPFGLGAAEVGLEFICLSVYHDLYVSEAVLNSGEG